MTNCISDKNETYNDFIYNDIFINSKFENYKIKIITLLYIGNIYKYEINKENFEQIIFEFIFLLLLANTDFKNIAYILSIFKFFEKENYIQTKTISNNTLDIILYAYSCNYKLENFFIPDSNSIVIATTKHFNSFGFIFYHIFKNIKVVVNTETIQKFKLDLLNFHKVLEAFDIDCNHILHFFLDNIIEYKIYSPSKNVLLKNAIIKNIDNHNIILYTDDTNFNEIVEFSYFISKIKNIYILFLKFCNIYIHNNNIFTLYDNANLDIKTEVINNNISFINELLENRLLYTKISSLQYLETDNKFDINLDGIQLTNINLSNIDLQDSVLDNIDVNDVDLTNSNLNYPINNVIGTPKKLPENVLFVTNVKNAKSLIKLPEKTFEFIKEKLESPNYTELVYINSDEIVDLNVINNDKKILYNELPTGKAINIIMKTYEKSGIESDIVFYISENSLNTNNTLTVNNGDILNYNVFLKLFSNSNDKTVKITIENINDEMYKITFPTLYFFIKSEYFIDVPFNNINLTFSSAIFGNSKIQTIQSDICFIGDTNVHTDQGIVKIKNINPDIHTIHKRKILFVTKTTLKNQKHLIRVKKNALYNNIPNNDTFMTLDHCIFYENQLISSKYFTMWNKYFYKVPYKGEYLYNIVMQKHEIIEINNMKVETLHPEHRIINIYDKLKDIYN